MNTRLPFLLFPFLLTTILVLNVQAQSSGTIGGTVTDSNKAKISGAQVTVRTDTGLQLATSTDESGAFKFTNLVSGTYYLEVKADGFSVYSHDQIRLTRGDDLKINIVLEIAAINESVVVTATGTAQRIDDAAKVISVLDAQNIEDRHHLGLAEAVRGTPGIRIQQQGSPGSLTTV